MSRDVDPHEREESGSEGTGRTRPGPGEPRLSREHELVKLGGYRYRLSPAERQTMNDIGRFRTVALADLAHHRYEGDSTLMRRDIGSLRGQGLVQTRTVWAGPKSEQLALVALTKVGKKLLERIEPPSGQTIYSGFVKPAEVRHDAAIYRMYQQEKAKIERAGGRVRRVILDYELKKNVYSPLAKAKGLPPLDYARRQAEVAQQNDLKVIDGKIPLPDLRIELETSTGSVARTDLELATDHYHGPALQAKADAGFKMYVTGDSPRLSRALEEREITASILSI